MATRAPERTTSSATARAAAPSIDSRVVGAVLLAFGAVWLLREVGFLGIGWETLVAALLTALGVGMVVTPRGGNGVRLTIAGVGLTLALASMSSGVNVRAGGGFGDPIHAPTSLGSLQEEYRLTAGDMVLDLSAVPFEPGTRAVQVEMVAGELRVTVPDDVRVEVDAEIWAGDLTVNGDEVGSGIGVDRQVVLGPEESDKRLVLRLHVQFGEINVFTSPADPPLPDRPPAAPTDPPPRAGQR